jgi:hypothetical protein
MALTTSMRVFSRQEAAPMPIRPVGMILAAVVLVCPSTVVVLGCGSALAQPEAGGGDACGAALSPPIRALWLSLGGAQGRLGCPSGGETAAARSPQGTTGEEAMFTAGVGGAILRHDSGAHAGQTFALEGCVWRLYFQYGGPSGWLGFPISQADNTPDGKRQAFEGGQIVYLRAGDTCFAKRPEEVAAAPAAPNAPPGTSRLDLFEDAEGRRLVAASETSARRAAKDGYRAIATLGFVFTGDAPGLAPLKAYWSPSTGDHDAVATADGERADLAAGYEFDGLQGYVWTDPRPGASPLKRFWNPQTKTSLLVSDEKGEADAVSRGYVFVRVEGYVQAGG